MSKRQLTSVSLGRRTFARRSAGSNMFYAIVNGSIIGRNLVMEWIRQTLRYFAPFDVTRRLQYTRTLFTPPMVSPVQFLWRARPQDSGNITLGNRTGNPPFLWVAQWVRNRRTEEFLLYPPPADIESYNDIASDALTALGYY